MKKLISITIIALALQTINVRAENINILKAGAKADGKTICTEIIQNAIDKISENGGGSVIVPPGKFVTGSIVLKNGVTLEVQQGALLLGSTNLDD